MAYQTSQRERRDTAQAAIQSRNSRNDLSYYASVEKNDKEEPENDTNWFLRSLATIGDLAANVVTGATKAIEGIVDLGIGLTGAIGGIWDEDFEKSAKNAIAYDWTMETFGNDVQGWFENSYTENGGIVESIASGLGQMLPAIGASLVTGGAALPAMLTLGGSATGTSAESAYNDGADFGEGLLYGAVRGATEIVTEKLTGGFGKLFGGGLFDNVLKSIAPSGVRRIAVEALGEGFEEIASELGDPLTKTIYKGADALNEYGEADYWKGVGQAGLAGAGTSVIYGQTFGRALHQTGKDADINDAMQELHTLEEKRENLDAKNKLDTPDKKGVIPRTQIDTDQATAIDTIENTLKSANDRQRQKLIKRHGLGQMFDENGSVRQEFATLGGIRSLASRFTATATGEDTEAVSAAPLQYRTAAMSDEEATSALREGKQKAFTGTFSQAGTENVNAFKRVIGAVRKMSGGKFNFIIAEPNAEANGYLSKNGRTIVIGADQFENGTAAEAFTSAWKETLIHETEHGTHYTTSGRKLFEHLANDSELWTSSITNFIERGYFGNNVDAAVDKASSLLKKAQDETLTEAESKEYQLLYEEMSAIMSEKMFANDSFINRLVKYDTKLATRIINGIKDMLSSLGNKIKNIKNKTARGIYEFYRKAERLYMKAIQESGYVYSNKQIVSANREEESIDNEDEISYSKKRQTPYIQWQSDALAWANKHSTEIGDIGSGSDFRYRYFYEAYDPDDTGHATDYRVLTKISHKNKKLINEWYEEILNNNGRSDESLHESIDEYELARRKHQSDNGTLLEETSTDGQVGEVYQGESEGIRQGTAENSDRDVSGINYSRKPVTISASDVERLRTIAAAHSGERVSINSFTSEDIQKAEPWARKFYQELGTKSPFFRAWFGDWRAHDITSIRSVDVETIQLEDVVFASGDYNNQDTGWNIHAGSLLRGETVSHARGKQISVKALTAINSIIENAVLLDTEVSNKDSNKKSKGTAFMHKLYAPISYDGKSYIAKITVEEFFDFSDNTVKRRGYNLCAIKIEAVNRSLTNETLATTPQVEPASIYRISELYDFVKQYDKDFHPKTVNPLLLNEDGTPKVFYHGTYQQFTAFDPAEMQDREGSFFFAENHEDAEGYGSNIYEVYLQANNLANYDDQPPEFYKLRNKRAQVAWLKERGYDGWYADMDSDGWGELSVFSNTQIKSATDNIGTFDGENPDIRYSRKPTPDSVTIAPRIELSQGQIKKILANGTRMKVFSRVDAEAVIDTITQEMSGIGDAHAKLVEKKRERVIQTLWQALNTEDAGYRGKTALEIANYIIDNAIVRDVVDSDEVQHYVDIVTALRPYLHRINLDAIKGDIQHRYDKDRSPFLLWGKRKGEKGIGADVVAMEIAGEYGIYITDAVNEAEIFEALHNAYRNAVASLKTKATSTLGEILSKTKRKEMQNQIVSEVLEAYNSKGKKSRFAEIIKVYTDKIAELTRQLKEERARNSAINRVVDRAQKIKDWKLGTFLNATQYKPDVFKKSIERFASIKYRGDLNKSGTRKLLGELLVWYNKDNPMVQAEFSREDGVGEYITDIMSTISKGNGDLTTEELRGLCNVLDYFHHFVETYNKVYREGRWVEAAPIAKGYVHTLQENQNIRSGIVLKLSGSKFMQMHGDPMAVARRMDMYAENGFFTQTMEHIRDGAVNAAVMEMNLMKPIDGFRKQHKQWYKNLGDRTITVHGKVVPVQVGMYVYMAYHREQAVAGLLYSGFEYLDEKGKSVRVDAAITDGTELLEAEAQTKATEILDGLKQQFNDTDIAYMAILSDALAQCKKAKESTDMRRMGYTNTVEGFYIPIRRANVAHDIDKGYIEDVASVSHASFNKDTVKGARQELFVQAVDAVVERHIHGMSLYAGLSEAIDEYNRIYNLNTVEDHNKPISVATESKNTWKEGNEYITDLIADIKGNGKKKAGSRALAWIRSGYAKFQLGANPKVWVTQLSSIFASSSILDYTSIIKGFSIKATDIDKYCPLAELRNSDNTVALAQGVMEKVGKVGDFFMTPIGKVDRFVVCRLFGACQVQVHKNGGGKIGTVENKTKAGKLLKQVILETQQNALATERSAAMRSDSEFIRTFTMFTADSMKVIGRVIDSIGESYALKARIKNCTSAEERAKLQAKRKIAHKKAKKSVAALVATATFMALIAQAFRSLYRKDDDKEPQEIAENMAIDMFGNMLGGLPIIKDVYAFIFNGYDLDSYNYSVINNLLESGMEVFEMAGEVASGTMDGRDMARLLKNLLYSTGQLFGIPTRNLYNVVYGLTNRISPESAYEINNLFYTPSFATDLKRAVDNEDEGMIETITGVMLDENVGTVTSSDVRAELSKLIKNGHSGCIPRGVGDSVSYEGVDYPLTNKQKERFKSVYGEANEYASRMLAGKVYKDANEKVRAKAIKLIYDISYNMAIEDLIGADLEAKNVLFSKAIDLDKLAIIIVRCRELKADLDREGNAIAGSRCKKVESYVESLRLTAAQKYMIMGYLGYKNTNGEQQVRSYIQSLRLTKAQKEELFSASGY